MLETRGDPLVPISGLLRRMGELYESQKEYAACFNKVLRIRRAVGLTPGRHLTPVQHEEDISTAILELFPHFIRDTPEPPKPSPAASITRLVARACRRAKRIGVPFDCKLTFDEIPVVCPILKIPLSTGHRYNAPSLDRIVPRLGYVPGNVRIISWRANALRNNGSASELRAVAEDAATLEPKTS